MPELPEVETIRSQLSEHLPFKIKKVETSRGLKKNILHTKLEIENKIIIKISRKGKMLDFIFNDGSHLLSHLGMTGAWLIGKNLTQDKHSHLILTGEKSTIIYQDYRRFGHLYYYNAEQAEKKLATLGLDLTDPQFNLEYLIKSLKRYPERVLKVALLDQKFFAGTGNYIANEICAHALILPTRKIKNIKASEFVKILTAIQTVIHAALATGGATFGGGYQDTKGEKGKAASDFIVFYQKICQRCLKTPVEKIFLAQRGTYYCSKCQK